MSSAAETADNLPQDSKIALSGPGDFMNRFGQILHIVQAFGIYNLARAVYDKKREQEDQDVHFTKQPPQVSLPIHFRRTVSDMTGYAELFGQEVYGLPESCRRAVGENTIVDLGAFNGAAAAYFASQFPRSKVLAVEPNPDNYRLLSKNTEGYGDQIEPIFAAATISDQPVQRVLIGNKPDNMLYAYTSSTEEAEVTHTPALTPEAILERVPTGFIGILKVDIEGAERELFNAPAIDKLLQHTGVLLIETHDFCAPGAGAAVEAAASRNGLKPHPAGRHTQMFVA